MLITSILAYYSLTKYERCPDEIIFYTATSILVVYRLSDTLDLNYLNLVNDMTDEMLFFVLFGLPDRLGEYLRGFTDELNKKFWELILPPPPPTRNTLIAQTDRDRVEPRRPRSTHQLRG